MLVMTPIGLYCPAGDFYIDPSRGVDHAVITHAHSDHARRGSRAYYCVRSGESLLRARLGASIHVQTFAFAQPFEINGVQLSFHPAGHILGSSQVRLKYHDEVWVASGDYKRDPDPTCEPFESVPCDVFVTEATFGTPAYVWPKNVDLGKQIYDWWRANAEQGINSVLFAYSLGKAQRVLGVLKPYADRPILCDPSVTVLNECYKNEGVHLAPTTCLNSIDHTEPLSGALFLVPQSFLRSSRAFLLGSNFETAFASGWMASKSRGYGSHYDRGFTMSDHADWNDLVRTILETGASKVYVQHRGHGSLVRHLRSLGIDAYPDSELKAGSMTQLSLFT